MSCPVCGEPIDTGETSMITIRDGVPVEVCHVQCWWARNRRLRELAKEEEELFGFAISTQPRPKGQA